MNFRSSKFTKTQIVFAANKTLVRDFLLVFCIQKQKYSDLGPKQVANPQIPQVFTCILALSGPELESMSNYHRTT